MMRISEEEHQSSVRVTGLAVKIYEAATSIGVSDEEFIACLSNELSSICDRMRRSSIRAVEGPKPKPPNTIVL